METGNRIGKQHEGCPRRILTASALILLLSALAFSQSSLTAHKIQLASGKSFTLNFPADYEMIPAAEGLKRVRFFAKAPDGRIFVTDMYDLTDNNRGKVYILDDFNRSTGKFGKVTTYLSGLRNPNSVAFHTDQKGTDWIYIAETDKLTRRRFKKGEASPTDRTPQTLVTFPDYGLSYKYGGWHLTRTVEFGGNGKMYVSVGSSCNSCKEKEEVRATVLEMNPDGSGQKIFAKGLRNAVWIKWIGNYLYATNQGSDHLGLNRPDETFYALSREGDYGWPGCHSSNGKLFADRTVRGADCRGVESPYAYFPAHSSALGFDYFDRDSDNSLLKDAFVVALHGSTNKRLVKGYKVVLMRKGEKVRDLITGFLKGRTVNGRPCGVMRLSDQSFLLSDDHTGIVYLVRKKKTG